MLQGCRALDLTGPNGYLCGKILADLGCDVIKVERPGGDPGRRTGPFWGDDPDPEKSLYWFAYNTNKRGITLNIESASDRAIFKDLVKTADFVIESSPPGYLAGLNLGYADLTAIKKNIILTSITPFGQTGPYSLYEASDIVVTGMAGILYQNGDVNRPPVNMSVPQACLLAGADGAAGTMIAYYHREQTGQGQQVDVSMQQSAAWFQANAIPLWELNKAVLKRAGAARSGTSRDSTGQRQMWECKDGYVFFVVIGGKQGAKALKGLTQWMDSEGRATAFLKETDWDNFDMWRTTREVIAQINQPVAEFFKLHTKSEILDGATRRHISICPLSSMHDLVNDPNLREREFWREIDHPELGTRIPYPREFIRSSRERFDTRFRAPLIGEHNEEILAEVGASKQAVVSPGGSGIHAGRSENPETGGRKDVFSGLTVVAFGGAVVGPLTMKMFADHGATVVRIESTKRPCTLRTSGPYKDAKPGLNRAGYFNFYSGNILSLALNMEDPKAVTVAKRLVRKSDLVMENFTPAVMPGWGLGYEALKQIKPDIIMLRQSGFGSQGPYSQTAAFGMILAAIAGLPNFVGWPDGLPLPLGVSAYTDCISPRFATSAVIAALDRRNKTGEGQLLDLAQFETALYFILPAILGHVSDGREPTRMGNRSANAAPHGVFPCKGEDRWCTIAVETDAQWARLCQAMGKPELSSDPNFSTLKARKDREDEIEQLVGQWTAEFEAEEVMTRLQAEGVPAGVVKNTSDVYSDPQLRGRNFFWPMEHAEMGMFTHLGQSFQLSKTPSRPRSPSPTLGEHTEYVCTKLLGMSDEEFVGLMGEGVFE